MNRTRADTLRVPGATLHYEVCGTGPVLLLIPGGPADAGGFAPIRNVLSDRYTVVTYDPRGVSRSPLDGEPQDTTVQIFAHDAHQLLAALGTEPAYVLGDSGGALVGLELVSQHPEQVRVLVAHEPPLTRLLDDADEHARFGQEVYDTYRSEGIGPAMGSSPRGPGWTRTRRGPSTRHRRWPRRWPGCRETWTSSSGTCGCRLATTRPTSPGSGRGRSRWPWARLRRGSSPIEPP
jgi:pimeloyl-ACP methyl ester carboxylesterase